MSIKDILSISFFVIIVVGIPLGVLGFIMFSSMPLEWKMLLSLLYAVALLFIIPVIAALLR